MRSLMTTFAQHVRQEAVLSLAPTARGRIHGASDRIAPEQIRAQATLVRIVSIVETFVSGQLVLRLEAHAPAPRAKLLEAVFVTVEDQAISTWPNLIQHYDKWLGIKFSSLTPTWSRLHTLTNARNAVAHGLGELTRRQARKNKAQLEADLKQVGIHVSGGRLFVSTPALRAAVAVSRDFVSWLDEKLEVHDAQTGLSVAT